MIDPHTPDPGINGTRSRAGASRPDPSPGNRDPGLLEGRVALVAGGSGNVGRHIVQGLLDEGATVVVPSRSARKAAEVRERHGADGPGKLVVREGDIADESRGPALVNDVLAEEGRLDAAVASLGRFVPAPSVLEASPSDLRAAVDGYLMAHFSVARNVIPLLRSSAHEGTPGSFTSINGPLAWDLWSQQSSLVSVATAAQAMLARAVMDQESERSDGVRVHEVVIHTAVGWGDAEKEQPLPPEEIGRYLARLVSPLGSHLAGSTVHLRSPDQVAGLEA